jgi:hypothetical protein
VSAANTITAGSHTHGARVTQMLDGSVHEHAKRRWRREERPDDDVREQGDSEHVSGEYHAHRGVSAHEPDADGNCREAGNDVVIASLETQCSRSGNAGSESHPYAGSDRGAHSISGDPVHAGDEEDRYAQCARDKEPLERWRTIRDLHGRPCLMPVTVGTIR